MDNLASMGYVMNIEPKDCPQGFFTKKKEVKMPSNSDLIGTGDNKQSIYSVAVDSNALGSGHCEVELSLQRPWLDTADTSVSLHFEVV